MKDDTSTPITDESSPNEFERGKPGTSARSDAEGAIEELRQKGGVFVNAVHATRMPMALTDPSLPGNPIVFANEAFLKLSGYSIEEVLGQQPHFMNGPGTDPKDAARFTEAIRADQDDIIETVQYRKNGARFIATVLISGFRDEQGRTLNHFMSWLDVTRRVDAEDEVAELKTLHAALQDSEQKYRALFDTMGQGYQENELIRDESGRAVDHRVLEANPRSVELTGIPRETMLTRTANELFPGALGYWTSEFDRIVRGGKPERLEQEVAPLGRWFEVYVYPRGGDRFSLLFDDVTDRKRAEVALRESEGKYSALFAASPAPFLILTPDAPHFTIADVNDAYLTATRRTREELVGRPMLDAFPDNPDDPDADGVSNLLSSFERAMASREFELMDVQKCDIARPDGTFEERWWKPANAPVLDAKGSVVAIIHHVADVTTQHRAAEALQKSERHAQILLAELQHRVRNTLAVVRSIARRTAENTDTSEDMLAHFQGRLDAFSRVQAALTRSADAKVDLASLIEDELVAHAARDGEQLKVKGPAVALEPKAAERISLAIHELATNAVKHGALINGHGKIDVRWSKEPSDSGERLVLSWTESGVVVEADKTGREGFGMELLRRSLPYDLQAETMVDLRSDGMRFQLRMPLKRANGRG